MQCEQTARLERSKVLGGSLKFGAALALFLSFALLIGCGGGGGGGGGGGSTGCSEPAANGTPGLATVTGRVVVESTGVGIGSVQVQFFNASGTQVATISTDSCGYFVARVPSNSVRFHLNPTSLSSSAYYRQYTYGGKRYSALIATCTAPLPALTDGTVTRLPGGNIFVPATTGPPPPPPNGCS